jgi:hypothetical protein
MTDLDPVTVARDALLLLSSGRAAMAMRVLEGLPELIEAERRTVYGKGRWDAEVAMVAQLQPKTPSPSPTGPRRHKWLQSVLADPEGRAKARAVARLSDQLLDRVAAGRLTLAPAMWRRLRRALGADDALK